MGAIGEGKESAFFKVQVPESIACRLEALRVSLGVSIIPSVELPQSTALLPITPSTKDPLLVAKKLLNNFVNYALSYSRTFTHNDTNEPFIPAKIITDWYGNAVRKAQMDPVGFLDKIMRSED